VSNTCPNCNAPASGKFCSNCGAPLEGATCAQCAAPLTPGAKFCHRCGASASAGVADDPRSFASALPWTVAAIALVALIALVAGQRFSRSSSNDAQQAPVAAQAGDAPGGMPDISNMSPAEAAVRLYNHVMGAHERGRADTVQLFAPMAISAYQMIGNLDNDQRYDVGRIAAVSGDEQLARAEADSILAKQPTHLLGLILAEDAARMRKDAAAQAALQKRLLAAADAERAKKLPEYITHENDITLALDQAKRK